ncbi:MAG: XRE family transcriptional regulator [Actinomycetales bacterium]|nr:XRE family transcriptional regulator [Actinomycetales bacterium]
MTGTGDDARAEEASVGEAQSSCCVQIDRSSEAAAQAYRLAELRKRQRITQVDLAKAMGVGQPRVSKIERGDPSRAEVATLRAYVEALGGELEISATFGEQRLRIA